MGGRIPLRLLASETFPTGFAHLTYGPTGVAHLTYGPTGVAHLTYGPTAGAPASCG
ncbi:hypothetical protein ACQP00_25015 [Dactylosporangium sp. CS-047395]|uniref:hypothetical protein n=1 Tax=Dactylosporangium sp. CS-047395 TaxID=3239936 RepID=UPI003D91C0F7